MRSLDSGGRAPAARRGRARAPRLGIRRLLIVAASFVAGGAAVSVIAAGCGDTVLIEPGDNGGGGSGAFTSTGGGAAGTGGFGGPDASSDAFDEYVDPGCPDAGPPIEMFECDPYDQFNGDCAPGDGCFIYVQYPAEPCGQEIYGSTCVPEGPGQQGDPCDGPQSCAGGYVCVVSGSGTQCVQLCQLSGEDGCPPGLVCESIDVEGFGGCL